MSLAPRDHDPRRPTQVGRGPGGWVEEIGLAWLSLSACLGLYLGILAGRERLDLPAFAGSLREIGLSVLPAITLVAVALGLILGHQAVVVLRDLALPSLLVLTLGYRVVVELVPILAGILVAGRAGVALTVRQATLVASGEMDGLVVAGLDPIRFTLGPPLLAMLLMSFALTVWVSLVSVTTLTAWLWARAGVPPAVVIDGLRQSLTPADLTQMLAKPLLFAVAIALIATVCGLTAGRDSQGVARAATRAMIGAVTVILLIDLACVLSF